MEEPLVMNANGMEPNLMGLIKGVSLSPNSQLPPFATDASNT